MKILVFSDSHGEVTNMEAAANYERPDLIFHLGDNVRDARALQARCPDTEVAGVAGNTDPAGSAELELVRGECGVTLLLCHGHVFDVKRAAGIRRLSGYARGVGAAAALFGHTHDPLDATDGGVRLLNPGAVGRRAQHSTYGVLSIEDGVLGWQLKNL